MFIFAEMSFNGGLGLSLTYNMPVQSTGISYDTFVKNGIIYIDNFGDCITIQQIGNSLYKIPDKYSMSIFNTIEQILWSDVDNLFTQRTSNIDWKKELNSYTLNMKSINGIDWSDKERLKKIFINKIDDKNKYQFNILICKLINQIQETQTVDDVVATLLNANISKIIIVDNNITADPKSKTDKINSSDSKGIEIIYTNIDNILTYLQSSEINQMVINKYTRQNASLLADSIFDSRYSISHSRISIDGYIKFSIDSIGAREFIDGLKFATQMREAELFVMINVSLFEMIITQKEIFHSNNRDMEICFGFRGQYFGIMFGINLNILEYVYRFMYMKKTMINIVGFILIILFSRISFMYKINNQYIILRFNLYELKIKMSYVYMPALKKENIQNQGMNIHIEEQRNEKQEESENEVEVIYN